MPQARDYRVLAEGSGERRIACAHQMQDEAEGLRDRIGKHHADEPCGRRERAMAVKMAEAGQQAQAGGDRGLP